MRPEAAAWEDLFQAQEFVERRFEDWSARVRIDPGRVSAIRDFFANRRSNLQEARRVGRPCPGAANGLAPPRADEPPQAKSLRYWVFLAATVQRLQKDGLLSLSTAHALHDEIDGHRDALSRRINIDDMPDTPPADEGRSPPPPPRYLPLIPELADPPAPPKPRRPLIEVLLDPRNIQYLLVFGGALMVVGLVILLWINKFFTPPVVAGGLAAINAAVLALGWWLIRGTPNQTAGRALTLLACLVMPLNLWYLNANNLITLENNLWMVGVLCCALYAASAYLVGDEAFVYVLVGGIVGTGLLVIAKAGQFWEIVAPASMLVILGLICIHAERAFPDEKEGPFTRRRFGLAFFFSGHAALAAGLLLVLGAFVTGKWLYPAFEHLYRQYGVGPSAIVGESRGLALLLVLLGAYAYVYSDLVVRHVGYYVHAAAGMFLWAAVLCVEMLRLELGVEAVIALLAGLGLVVNLVQETQLKGSRYTRAFPIVGLLLPLAALLVGLEVFRWHLKFGTGDQWAPADITWGYVLAMAITIASCRVGAHLYRESASGLADLYFIATAAATLAGAASLLSVLGLKTWEPTAHLLMLIPIAYCVAAFSYQGGPSAKPLMVAAHLSVGVLLLTSLVVALQGFTEVAGERRNLALAVFFLECLVFYALASRLHGQGVAVNAAAAFGCGVVWQMFTYWGISPEWYTVVFAVVGLVLLILYRTGAISDAATETAFSAGNALLALSFVSAALLALSRLAVEKSEPFHAGLCLVLAVVALACLGLVRQRHWRRMYAVAAVGEALMAFLVLTLSSGLTPAQKWQIFCTVAGVVVLIASHVAVSREGERQDDLAGFGLFFGSLLVGLPQAFASIHDRIHDRFTWYNEIGFLAAALVLMTSGFMMQLKSTTVVGAILTGLYFVTLLIFIPWSQLNAVALTVTIGGGVLFGLGLVLSVFRDSLLKLPDRIKNREGVFRVLAWR